MAQQHDKAKRKVKPVIVTPRPAPQATVPAPRGGMFTRPVASSPTQREARRQARGGQAKPTGTVTAKVLTDAEGELMLFGTIGQDWFGEGITAVGFNEALKALGEVPTVRLRINSGGGDVFEATAIYNMLVKHKAHKIIEIEGVAASAATLITMAGDDIHMSENAHFMIHAASGGIWGNAVQLRQYLKLLDNADELIRLTYAARTGLSDADLVELMAFDNWMKADRALELGFIDVIDEAKTVTPHVDPDATAGANARRPGALEPERLAAMASNLLSLSASVRGASFSNPTGSSPPSVPSSKDSTMNKKLRAMCIAAGMTEGLNDEQANAWLDANWDAVMKPAATKPKALPAPLKAETKEEFMQRCKDEGGDDASCEAKWTESSAAATNCNVGLSASEIISIIEAREQRAIAQRKAWRKEVDDNLELAFGDAQSVPATLRDACYGLQDDGVSAVRAKIQAARKEAEAGFGETIPIRMAGVQPRQQHLDALKAGVLVRSLRNFSSIKDQKLSSEELLEKVLPESKRAKGWDDFSRMPLMKVAEECLIAGGVPYERLRRMDPTQIAMAAMGLGHVAGIRNDAALHVTGTLAEITRDAINKSLVAGYENAPQTWRGPGRQGTSVSDFKEIRRVQLSGAPNMPVWDDNTDPQMAKLANESERYAVEARAEGLSFSWRLVLNDDLNAISRHPQILGDACGRTVNALFWLQITLNAVMADGQALFLETPAGNRKRSNLITGSATPTNSTIGSMRKLMRLMRGLNTPEGNEGEDVLNLTPAYIVGPAALEELILKQVLSTADPASGGNSGVYNTARTLTPVIEPLLDAASATAFYLFADPARIDTVEVTFLEGQEQPITVEYIDQKNLSQNYTVIQSFGAKPLNHRGIIKHAGA